MPFKPPLATLEYWRRTGMRPVTDADIGSLEKRLGAKAPPSYVEFMKTFGSVEFSHDIDSQFSYVYEEAPEERRTRLVGFIKTPEKALRYYEGWQNDDDVSLPPHLLPFAMDQSQGELLIEFGKPTERIFYWNFDTHDRGSGVTKLGFVADDMYEFISSLKPYGG
jgi:SMI1/KNR4 family protein SUKH-1